MTTSQIDTAWPLWATTAPDEIRRLLLPEQWGPWRGTFPCINSNANATEGALVSHYAEPPHFFYCEAHLAAVRKSRGTTKPWAARDQGLCISCRKPAERKKPVPMQFRVACVEAERTNATVARLMTNGYCQSCNPRNPDKLPLCRGRVCRENGQQRRIQRAGCCNISGTSRRRHCAECCAAAAANLSAQVMPSSTSAAGAAARRKSGDERREQIRDLRCEGLDNRAIADRLGVHVRTVQRALEDASGVATDQT